ncbi:MAG: undecaprenyl/decaprenyl-phosphate alpha-N-acetylglucosaminyl 1-phosphate transferase [Clostridia bacterium]|nr:undecaprenyl/decaprenyl-phosphate alpha-N-acetylglucosaminyl 1-phosphate transferase [Clostridia bacterium]
MIVWICLLVFAFCFVSVPPVIALAWRVGAVDVPMDWRRMHPESIARAGGISIYVSFLIGCVLLGRPSLFLVSALAGGALLLAVGLADDIFCLGAWTKLFFQIVAAIATVLGGGVANGWSAFAAVLWVVTLTNAHNFIDGLDGLFAGCAAIESALLAAVYLLGGRGTLAAPLLVLATACLSFRYYNRFPAQIFAGDCGSGTVGFLLGVLSLPLFQDHGLQFSALVPFFLFAYPLTDLITAVVRRLMRGKSPFAADRAHLHHRITAVGLLPPQCDGVLLSVTAALGGIGVLLSTERYLALAALSCLGAALLMMRIRHYILNFA